MSEETKVCIKCGAELPIDRFALLNKKRDSGVKYSVRRKMCRKCHYSSVRDYRLEWRSRPENKAKEKASYKLWCAKNREYLNAGQREYWQQNISKLRAAARIYSKRSRQKPYNQLKAKFRGQISARLRSELRRRRIPKTEHTFDLVGCTPKELRVHIERQFKDGMTWENYGKKGWHVDHIVPCNQFDFNDPEQRKKCFHYTNLRPLWWWENLKKGSKVAA